MGGGPMEAPDSMREFMAYHRRMLAVMAGICLAVFVILFAVMRDAPAWSLGFLFGATAQLVKFGYLDIATVTRIAADATRASVVQLKASFLSLALFALALVGVFKLDLNIWAFAAGVFLPRLILILDTYIRPNPFGPPPASADGQAREETLDA